MFAEVKSEFSSGFYISEEAIKKIEDLILRRLGTQPNFTQSYSVRRSDSAKINYTNSSELISKEENGKVDQVTALLINAKSDISLLSIEFEKSEKSKLVINSEDRDSALLLSADLKEYLKSEVFVRKLSFLNSFAKSRFAPLLGMIFSMTPLLGGFWIISKRASHSPTLIDLKRSTIDDKLNFIISKYFESKEIDSNIQYLPMYMIIFLLISIAFILIFSSNILYPAYTFYWGKEISRYDSNKSTREKIIWGVLIALILSVAGSIVASKITH